MRLIGAAHLVLIQKVNTLVDLHEAVYYIGADYHFTANLQYGDFAPTHQLAQSISPDAGVGGSFFYRQADSAI